MNRVVAELVNCIVVSFEDRIQSFSGREKYQHKVVKQTSIFSSQTKSMKVFGGIFFFFILSKVNYLLKVPRHQICQDIFDLR